MMDEDALWGLEEELWTGGEAPWKTTLHLQNVMAFAEPTGLISGAAVLESLKDAPRWRAVEITQRAYARPTAGVAVLGYRAEGQRPGQTPYRAYCTSTYVEDAGRWKLVQHQQTPILP